MRGLAILAAAAAGLAALVPTVAPAAELDLPRDGCERGQVWNGYRCEWARPRVSEAPPVYREARPVYREAPPDYESYAEYEQAPVYFARPAYVARAGLCRAVLSRAGRELLRRAALRLEPRSPATTVHRHHRWR